MSDSIVGKRIIGVVDLPKDAMDKEGWEDRDPTIALKLEDGTFIYASADKEGNAPGHMFGQDKEGGTFILDEAERPEPKILANEFSKILRKWLTSEQMFEVTRLNALQANPSICHSHDFCDSNMAMDEAARNLGMDLDVGNEVDAKLWNEAWDIAKKAEFRWVK